MFWVCEVLWQLDMFICFFVIPKGRGKPRFRTSAWSYLTSMFVPDLIATVISSLMLLIPNEHALIYSLLLRLVRVSRLQYYLEFFHFLVYLITLRLPKNARAIESIFMRITWLVVVVHTLVCCWIYLGSIDAIDDAYLTKDED